MSEIYNGFRQLIAAATKGRVWGKYGNKSAGYSSPYIGKTKSVVLEKEGRVCTVTVVNDSGDTLQVISARDPSSPFSISKTAFDDADKPLDEGHSRAGGSKCDKIKDKDKEKNMRNTKVRGRFFRRAMDIFDAEFWNGLAKGVEQRIDGIAKIDSVLDKVEATEDTIAWLSIEVDKLAKESSGGKSEVKELVRALANYGEVLKTLKREVSLDIAEASSKFQRPYKDIVDALEPTLTEVQRALVQEQDVKKREKHEQEKLKKDPIETLKWKKQVARRQAADDEGDIGLDVIDELVEIFEAGSVRIQDILDKVGKGEILTMESFLKKSSRTAVEEGSDWLTIDQVRAVNPRYAREMQRKGLSMARKSMLRSITGK